MTKDWQDWQSIRQQAHGDVLSYMALMRPETKFGPQHYLFRDVISDLAARRLRFVCLSTPPRHSKSYTFSQALPAWWLGNSPKSQVIATSYGAALAQSFGSSLRADMASELYGQVFSKDSQPSGSSSSGTDFATNAGGKYKATGVGGALTGFGGDLIVVDDPVKNAETADSPTYKDMLEKFFGETLYTRLMPGGVIVVMMTRWREDDLIGYILKNFGDDWTYINVPALAEDQDVAEAGRGLLGRSAGDALWPEFFSANDLSRTRKILGEQAFQALYQGRPVSAKGGTLAASDLLWAEPGDTWDGLKQEFWSWDLALTETQRSDYTVGTLWQVYADGRLRMSDYVRDRGNFTDVIALIQSVSESGVQSHLVEHSHMGLAIQSQLELDSPELEVTLVKPKGTKLARLQQCLPKWRDKQVLLNRLDRQDFQDCIDELIKAGLTAHDDFLDSCTQAILTSSDLSDSGLKLAQPSARAIKSIAQSRSYVATPIARRRKIGWA